MKQFLKFIIPWQGYAATIFKAWVSSKQMGRPARATSLAKVEL